MISHCYIHWKLCPKKRLGKTAIFFIGTLLTSTRYAENFTFKQNRKIRSLFIVWQYILIDLNEENISLNSTFSRIPFLWMRVVSYCCSRDINFKGKYDENSTMHYTAMGNTMLSLTTFMNCYKRSHHHPPVGCNFQSLQHLRSLPQSAMQLKTLPPPRYGLSLEA